MDNQYRPQKNDCECGQGTLPECLPLASAYVPPQPSAEPRYRDEDALARGTLFPGLDLPFLNQVNADHPYAGTPLGELMALDFVFHELNLYLDTHTDDTEAFAYLKKIGQLLNEGRRNYVRRFGPLTAEETTDFDRFRWIEAPWPWIIDQKGD